MKNLLILLLIGFISMAEAQKIKYGNFSPQLKADLKDTTSSIVGDTAAVLRSDISDSLRVAADTTALKLFSGKNGTSASLYELASGVNIGGGDFVFRLSGYISNKGTVFDASGGGYWIRKEWLEDKDIKLQWFGVRSDATGVNNKSYFQNAVDVLEEGGQIIFPRAQPLAFDSITVVLDATHDDVTIDLNKCTVTMNSTGVTTYFIDASGDTTRRTTLADTVFFGIDTLIVASDANIVINDWIMMVDTSVTDNYPDFRDSYATEIHQVRKVLNNAGGNDTLILFRAVNDTFPGGGAGPTRIYEIDGIDGLEVKNGKFKSNYQLGNGNNRAKFVSGSFSVNSGIQNIEADSIGQLFNCAFTFNNYLENCKIKRSRYIGEIYQSKYFNAEKNYIEAIDVSPFQFISGSDHATITNNEIFSGDPYASTAAGITVQESRNPTITHNKIHGDFKLKYGISLNRGVDNAIVTHNQISGIGGTAGYAITVANSRFGLIELNQIQNCKATGIHSDVSAGNTFRNNVLENITVIGSIVAGLMVSPAQEIYYDMNNTVITGHRFKNMIGASIIELRTAGGVLGFANNTEISGNSFDCPSQARLIKNRNENTNTRIFNNSFVNPDISQVIFNYDTTTAGDGYWETSDFDLSGTGDTSIVFIADRDYSIIRVDVIYVEATAAADSVLFQLGEGIAGSYDYDEYMIDTTEVSMTEGTVRSHVYGAGGSRPYITNIAVPKGSFVTFACVGGKSGDGVIRLKIHYIKY